MTARGRSLDDEVIGAWAPAGWGRIAVVLGQGVVIHKFVFSLRAGATGVAQALAGIGESEVSVGIAGTTDDLRASPFVAKVLRNGVPGLLASPRKTLVPWDEVVSADYRGRVLNRGVLRLRTPATTHTLRFLQNTVVIGDPGLAFVHYLGERFTHA